ncbi:uncharacterized protein LOC117344446 [Pecten maximus]|uniref:uncharacterized protein LOC117344446 n=1 Tax=Pecten maximus TaxID=6579 RepID=UPI0014588354|nr:uncharacterized protein LOC117344446 [Pecten maximus]
MSVIVNNDEATTLNNIIKSFKPAFKKATGDSRRMRSPWAKKQCIKVCMDITAARSPTEPSSVHLAKHFMQYLSDGGIVQTSDQSRTVLDIDKDSFKIKPKRVDHNGSPFVSISYGEFRVPVGEAAILKTNVIAEPAATAIEWFRKENDMEFKIEIDNEKYFGSSNLSPTLVIRRTNIEDCGHYLCKATNENGVGLSSIAFLSIQPGTIHDYGAGATQEVMTPQSRDQADIKTKIREGRSGTPKIREQDGLNEAGRSGTRQIREGRSGTRLIREGRSGTPQIREQDGLNEAGRSGTRLIKEGRSGTRLIREGRSGTPQIREGRAERSGTPQIREGRSGTRQI